MIRSSRHILGFATSGKRAKLTLFLQEYRRLSSEILDDLWENGLSDQKINFSIPNNQLSIPSVLPNRYLKTFDTWLSARMRQCVGKQVCSMIKAAVRKRSKQLFMLRKLQREGKDTSRLQRKISLVKPNTDNIKAELDSRFVDFRTGVHFDLFVRVKTENRTTINLPIKHTKVSRKWLEHGTFKKSIRLSEESLTLFYQIERAVPFGTRTVGADQGYKTCLTLSDQQATQRCSHGHDLVLIQAKLARKKKGSKGL